MTLKQAESAPSKHAPEVEFLLVYRAKLAQELQDIERQLAGLGAGRPRIEGFEC